MQSASIAVLVCPIWLLILTITGTGGFRWTTVQPNGHVIYACANGHAIFPWTYTSSPGDIIITLKWYSSRHLGQPVAIDTHGHFVPIPAYSNRVQFVSSAGIRLNNVTEGDSGNYSVQIFGSDRSGLNFTTSSFQLLRVIKSNQLLTSDGHLHAGLDNQPIYSNRTGQWYLVLSCGNFTYAGHPPFQVEWQTPTGNIIPSVSYHDRRFLLHVQTGGQYTCIIPKQAAADACLTSQPKANVSLDKTETRMTLTEARLNHQQQLISSLQTDNTHQQQLISGLQTNNTHQQDLISGLQSDNNYLQQLIFDLQKENTHRQQLITGLQTQNTHQQQLLTILNSKTSHQIGFFGVLSRSGVKSGHLPFSSRNPPGTNYGNAFNPASGTFSVPVGGLYYLTMTSTPTTSKVYPDADMYKNKNNNICRSVSSVGTYGQSITCSTIQHLLPGDQVFVISRSNLSSYSTSFAGFLIVSD